MSTERPTHNAPQPSDEHQLSQDWAAVAARQRKEASPGIANAGRKIGKAAKVVVISVVVIVALVLALLFALVTGVRNYVVVNNAHQGIVSDQCSAYKPSGDTFMLAKPSVFNDSVAGYVRHSQGGPWHEINVHGSEQPEAVNLPHSASDIHC